MKYFVLLLVGLCSAGCSSDSSEGTAANGGGGGSAANGATTGGTGPGTGVAGASSTAGSPGAGSSSAATSAAFVADETFIPLLCDAFKMVCDCNADQTDCPGNPAALALYDCLWYAADFGDDGMRAGISDGLREIESDNERLCRTLDTPIATCSGRFNTTFGAADAPYRENIWEFLDPKPTNPQALIDSCVGVPPPAE